MNWFLRIFCRHQWEETERLYHAESYDFYGVPCGPATLVRIRCKRCKKLSSYWEEDGKITGRLGWVRRWLF